MASFIVLLGPPGVGKGTQATIIAQRTGLPHVSSGDLFRENMKNQTKLGKQAQAFTDRGELVPDDLTIAMLRERLSDRTAPMVRSWMASRGRRLRRRR